MNDMERRYFLQRADNYYRKGLTESALHCYIKALNYKNVKMNLVAGIFQTATDGQIYAMIDLCFEYLFDYYKAEI